MNGIIRYCFQTVKTHETLKQKRCSTDCVKVTLKKKQSCRILSNSANPKQTRRHGSHAFEIQQLVRAQLAAVDLK